MAIEGELARAGIITLTSSTVFTRDTQFSEDVIVDGPMTVGDDVTVDGNLRVAGSISGTITSVYNLDILIEDVSATTGGYAIIPTDGAGKVSRWRGVLLGALSGGDLSIIGETSDGAISATYDLDFTDADPAATTADTGAIPSTASNIDVAAGEFVRLYPAVARNAFGVRCTVEITRV